FDKLAHSYRLSLERAESAHEIDVRFFLGGESRLCNKDPVHRRYVVTFFPPMNVFIFCAIKLIDGEIGKAVGMRSRLLKLFQEVVGNRRVGFCLSAGGWDGYESCVITSD